MALSRRQLEPNLPAIMSKKVELKQIALHALEPGRFQPRRHFDAEALSELAQSIREMGGLLQPIVVRPIDAHRYEIIAGERRWRACQEVGLSTVACLVGDYDDAQALQAAIVENINRSNLNIIEEATAYLRLQTEFFCTHDEIAAMVGKSRAAITNLLRLLKLDPRVQAHLIESRLTEGHGKLLAGLAYEQQYRLAEECIQKDLSVRQLETLTRTALQHKPASPKDPNIAHLENNISEQIGSPVAVEYDEQGRGLLRIQFQNLEILEGILERMGVAPGSS